jgi:hypothetical protein
MQYYVYQELIISIQSIYIYGTRYYVQCHLCYTKDGMLNDTQIFCYGNISHPMLLNAYNTPINLVVSDAHTHIAYYIYNTTGMTHLKITHCSYQKDKRTKL